MFRIALCDDNSTDLKTYRELLTAYASEILPAVEVLTFSTQQSLLLSVEDARDLIDLLFLDIRMPGIDGIDLADLLRKAGFDGDIVYLTESEEDMLRAFDVGAFNYLVKNKTSRERAAFVIQKAIASAQSRSAKKLLVRGGGESRSIPIGEIRFFQVKDHLIVVHYAQTTFPFLSSIGKIESAMRAHGFVRTHRSYLVSCRYIQTLKKHTVVLENGEEIPVSRGRRGLVEKMLQLMGKEFG